MRWHTVSPEALSWRELDDQLVVRNAESGNTHLLSPLAGEVLRTLLNAQRDMTIAEIAERVRGGDAEGPEWSEAIAEALPGLERQGLVRRVA